jgi:hypothetical protein
VWVSTPAGGIEPDRLRRIFATWVQPGLDGICIVTGPDDVVPTDLGVRMRVVRTTAPFRRGLWRNLATRWTPTKRNAPMLLCDADVALYPIALSMFQTHALPRENKPRAVSRANILIVTCRWGDDAGAAAFLSGACDVRDVTGRDTAPWHVSGVVVLSREDAIAISYVDETQGWGGEETWFCNVAVHIAHPNRATHRKQEKIANLERLRAVEALPPKELRDRAIAEILMTQSSVDQWTTWDKMTGPVPGFHVEGPFWAVRRDIASIADTLSWPVLATLDAGVVPADCIYEPLLLCTVEDYGA